MAWQVEGVREVINQIEIRDRSGLIDFARDGWVTTQLTVMLTIDSQVKAINYSNDTVNGRKNWTWSAIMRATSVMSAG